MNDIGKILTNCRRASNLKLKDVAADTGIDQALISKYEKGHRIPTDEHTLLLEQFYKLARGDLKQVQLAHKLYQILENEEFAQEAITLAETRIEYLATKKESSKMVISEAVQLELALLDELKKEYLALSKNDKLHLSKVNEHFSLNYTYESNKIEGNTLTLSETMLVINEGITISGKSINEHLEAINHHEAVELLYDFASQKVNFNQSVLLNFHGIILRGIDRHNAGRYRQVNVRILGAEHIPPEPFMVPKLMEDYFIFYKKHIAANHPVVMAAEMHERLVTIHPFIDGNGRTSRLVMNLILLMHGYPIAILKGDQASRLAYFQALEAVQVDANPEPFHLLVIDRLKAAYVERIQLWKR